MWAYGGTEVNRGKKKRDEGKAAPELDGGGGGERWTEG